MRFENKTILLISPQPWDHMYVSKHHYAIELAKRGNEVYFLEPPSETLASKVSVVPVPGIDRLRIVTYRPAFPFVIRFHARRLFDVLMRRQIRRIAAAIGKPVDVVWSFEFNLFSDLRQFAPAATVIFHPVDVASEPHHTLPAKTADIVITVSDDMLSPFSDVPVRRAVINHGLSAAFAAQAGNPRPVKSERVRVGYSGNLVRHLVNRDVIRSVVSAFPDVDFHFWGPHEVDATTPKEIADFISFLASAQNVTVHGQVSVEELARGLAGADCLILTYVRDSRVYNRSNSHKILEYLSTGKVTISSRIAMYKDHEDLLRMARSDDDADLPALFADTIARLDEFNSPELQQRRREFALDNVYERQIERIEALLS